MARPLTNPNNKRPLIRKVSAASKVKVIYDDAAADKFLKCPLFSGGPMPKLESARGKAKTTKKRAPPSGAPAGASIDAPLDFESGPPVVKKPYNILHEASYAMDAPGGDPATSWPHPPSLLRTLSVPREPHAFLHTNAAAPCARGFICENVTHYDLRFRHVCSL